MYIYVLYTKTLFAGTLVWLSNCSLPPVVLPTLENYQKLCLWGEWDNMRAVAEKLGEERCRFVRYALYSYIFLFILCVLS